MESEVRALGTLVGSRGPRVPLIVGFQHTKRARRRRTPLDFHSPLVAGPTGGGH